MTRSQGIAIIEPVDGGFLIGLPEVARLNRIAGRRSLTAEETVSP